jgi:glycosyltransferase involved in cell wall biosynthesis
MQISDAPKEASMPLIKAKYLLAISIPFFQDAQGSIWLDPLWHRDLMAHTTYIADLTVLAPMLRGTTAAPSWVQWETPICRKVQFQALPASKGRLKALWQFPRTLVTAWAAIGKAELVHSGVAGWPLPVGLAVNPLAILRRRKLFVNVESSFWRSREKGENRITNLQTALLERFARWSLKRADLGIYTNQGYTKSLPAGPTTLTGVIPASWIDAADVLNEPEALESWAKDDRPVHFLLPSRLERSKGVDVCIDALRHLEAAGIAVHVDIIGNGTLANDIAEFARSARSVRLRLLKPVAYGEQFNALLRAYDCILVPIVGDEQPRILYDAFAQARPVIATDTPGNLDIVKGAGIGCLVEQGNPKALAEAMQQLSVDRKLLREMGLRGRQVALLHTHAHMHALRAELLRQLVARR